VIFKQRSTVISSKQLTLHKFPNIPEIFVVSEMTYTVSSGTLNSTIPYHTRNIHRPTTAKNFTD